MKPTLPVQPGNTQSRISRQIPSRFYYFLSLTGLLMLLTLPGRAQSSGRKFHVGVKFGATFSQLDNLSFSTPRLTADGLPVLSGGTVVYDFFRENQSRSTGIVGGVFFRYGNRLFIQPELLLSSKGGSFDLIQVGLATQSVKVRMTTIDLPLLVGIQLGPLRLNAGPVVSLALSERNSLIESFQQYVNQLINQTTKQAVYGYQAGAGLTVLGLQLDLRREGSLGSIIPSANKCGCPNVELASKTNLWQLTAGFSF